MRRKSASGRVRRGSTCSASRHGSRATSRNCQQATTRSVSSGSSKRTSVTKRRCAGSTRAATRSRASISCTVGSRSRRRSRMTTTRRRSTAASSTSSALGQQLHWETAGFEPVLQMPAHPPSQWALAAFLADPHAKRILDRWQIGFEKFQALATARLRTPRGTSAATARRPVTARRPAEPRSSERSTRAVAAVPRSKPLA